MILQPIIVTEWGVNCYLLGDDRGNGIVIDPGGNPEKILAEAALLAINIQLIINTHGHGDHIGGNEAVQKATGAPIAIGRKDAPFLTDPSLNLSALMVPVPFTSPPASRLLDDGDEISIGDLKLTVISTPGHTPGGISLLVSGVVLTGDALFSGSIGRTDFHYCSHEDLLRGITEKLMALPDDITVCPGHGPSTTIGDERINNPYLQF